MANVLSVLTRKFPTDWIFNRHGGHRRLPSNLAIWLQYRVDGWDIARQQVINFVIFLCLFPIFFLMNRKLPGGRFWLLPAFLFFLLTPINFENHSWAFQSCLHFAVVFMTAAAYVGLARFEDARQHFGMLALFVLCVCAALYSFATGVGSAAVLTVAFVALSLKRSDGSLRSIHWAQWLTIALIVIAYCFWFEGYLRGQPASLSVYLKFFLNLVSLGHGYTETLSLWPGIVILGLFFVPAGLLLSRQQARSSNGLLAWIALGAATLAGMVLIAIGRAGDYGGQVDTAKFSRYAELCFLMIPVIAVLWWNVLACFPSLRLFALVAYWIVCITAYRDDLSFQRYQDIRNSRLRCCPALLGTMPKAATQSARSPGRLDSPSRSVSTTLEG